MIIAESLDFIFLLCIVIDSVPLSRVKPDIPAMPEPLKRLKFVAQSSVAEYEIVDSRPMRSIVLRGL